MKILTALFETFVNLPIAFALGVWHELTEDHGVSPDAEEIEITVVAVKEVK